MANPKSITPSFTLKVLAPSLLAVGSIAVLLLYIVNGIFEETNRLDSNFAERLTGQALGTLRDNLEGVVYDNAYWEDAAVKVSKPEPDMEWLDGTWGVNTRLDLYNIMFLVKHDGTPVYAAQGGKRIQISPEEFFGPDLDVLLETINREPTPRRVASGIIKTRAGIATVAASPVRWASKGEGEAAETGKVLVMAKIIDAEVLASMAKRYAMEELHFVVPGERPQNGSYGVASPSGELIGRLTWKNRSPGNIVREKYSYVVSMIVVMFLFMIAVLLYMSWKGFKDAHDSQSDAVAASLRDDLTGLANRRQMLASLSGRLAEARLEETPLSVIYADLDGFKEVNDSYGHEIGDMLLKAAAAGFAYLARDADVVARLGGDEFAMIMTGKDADERARALAQSMIDFLAEPMVFDGRIASVSVSVGIVDLESDEADVEEIIRRADVAMYAAKSQGRNCIHVYQKSLDYKRDENRSIATQLRGHIASGSLTVVYQPIVDARTRATKGVEALVRWPKGATPYFSPDVFIPVAEEFGLIEDLGYFVLTEACRQAAKWQDIFVSVNVSPIQFMNPNFAELVEETLLETGLDARRLEIEVTEGFIIDNAARANAIINRLHDMHVRVALDDFGTGFSSIGHLRRFKFDKLKLDRSMVSDILRQPSALRLVQGTIAMADALGLTVVAEGIEDENQVSVLRLAGCSQFQGYLFSKPVEAAQIADFIRESPAALTG